VLAIIVALGVYLVMNSGSLLKSAIETLGPEYLGVDVSLGSAEISLTEGTGELRHLVIGNPAGFDGPHAFSLGRVKLGLDPMGQSGELIVLKTIEVDAADLAIIARGRATNLQAIMAKLEGDAAQPEPAAAESGGSDMKLIIDKFAFTNARTSLDSDLLGKTQVTIPDIRLQDIGRKDQGISIREALTQLLRPIVRAASQALAQENLNVDEIKANAEQRLDEELKERVGTDLDGLKERFRN